jgi:hypothetical protein
VREVAGWQPASSMGSSCADYSRQGRRASLELSCSYEEMLDAYQEVLLAFPRSHRPRPSLMSTQRLGSASSDEGPRSRR